MWDIKQLCLSFLNLYIGDKFFTQLRSKEQTGYIVRASAASFTDEKGNVVGFSFLIQSSKYDPMELKDRIKKFIKNTHQELLTLDTKSFEQLKFNISQELQKKFTSNVEEFNFYQTEIMRTDTLFNIKDIMSHALEKITKDILINFYETYFITKATRKIRLVTIYKHKKN